MQREDRFTIEIEDANGAPTDISIDTNVVNENDPPGTYIGILNNFQQLSIGFLFYSKNKRKEKKPSVGLSN